MNKAQFFCWGTFFGSQAYIVALAVLDLFMKVLIADTYVPTSTHLLLLLNTSLHELYTIE